MTRDYKNVTEAGSGGKKSRTKKNKTTATGPKSLPGWLWLVSGVVIGGFVSFIIYLKLNVPIDAIDANNKQVKSEKKLANESTSTKTEQKAAEPNKQGKEYFQFYNILPNREVVLPDSDKATANDKAVSGKNQIENGSKITKDIQSDSTKSKSEKVEQDNQREKHQTPREINYVYTLQIGSFLSFKDADKRKANLALLGIGSRIHAIKTNNRTHYRVLVGPYDNINRVNEIDAAMKANNIKTLLLKEKG